MKITTLSQLDELVAKELGWIYWSDNNESVKGWIPNVYVKDSSVNFRELLSFFKEFKIPKYSTNLEHNQELINHIYSLDLDLNIQSNKYFCIARIEEVDRDEPEVLAWWDSVCGDAIDSLFCLYDIDSLIHSVPLAICLAFLKYKGIKVELTLEKTT